MQYTWNITADKCVDQNEWQKLHIYHFEIFIHRKSFNSQYGCVLCSNYIKRPGFRALVIVSVVKNLSISISQFFYTNVTYATVILTHTNLTNGHFLTNNQFNIYKVLNYKMSFKFICLMLVFLITNIILYHFLQISPYAKLIDEKSLARVLSR